MCTSVNGEESEGKSGDDKSQMETFKVQMEGGAKKRHRRVTL